MALTRATDKIIANADGNLNLSGIVTATKFVGDGSQLSGVSGLGTALSNVSTSPLNKFYYVDNILSIDSNTTIDVPTSAVAAYTNYAQVRVEENIDFKIESGDVVIDVLDLLAT